MTVRAMKAGAVEFLTKPFRDQDMLDAVQLALGRDRERRAQEDALAGLRARYETLTPREQEVVALVPPGLMNKQIAAHLGVSEITVKVHRGNVSPKIGAIACRPRAHGGPPRHAGAVLTMHPLSFRGLCAEGASPAPMGEG